MLYCILFIPQKVLYFSSSSLFIIKAQQIHFIPVLYIYIATHCNKNAFQLLQIYFTIHWLKINITFAHADQSNHNFKSLKKIFSGWTSWKLGEHIKSKNAFLNGSNSLKPERGRCQVIIIATFWHSKTNCSS